MSDDQDRTSQVLEPGAPRNSAEPGWHKGNVTLIAWAVVSVLFLAFIFLGAVPARIWRLGILHVDSKSIARIWTVEADLLPSGPPSWLMLSLYYGSLIVFVVGVLVAFRLLLESDNEPEGLPGEPA